MLFKNILLAFAAARLVAGHGAIIKAVGNMGGNGSAIGIDGSTPRDGSRRRPFQGDSTRFKNNNPDACGETLGGGPNDPAQQMAKVVADSNGLPMISPGGMVMMTLHQVNGDGAGPYECMIDSTGTGTGGWTKMEVVTNVPGRNSRSRAKAEDFPLTAKVPADQTCTGTGAGMEKVCMVRCNNQANAGPFGGCVPVTMVSGAGGAGAGGFGAGGAGAGGFGATGVGAGGAGAGGFGAGGAGAGGAGAGGFGAGGAGAGGFGAGGAGAGAGGFGAGGFGAGGAGAGAGGFGATGVGAGGAGGFGAGGAGAGGFGAGGAGAGGAGAGGFGAGGAGAGAGGFGATGVGAGGAGATGVGAGGAGGFGAGAGAGGAGAGGAGTKLAGAGAKSGEGSAEKFAQNGAEGGGEEEEANNNQQNKASKFAKITRNFKS